MMVFHDVASWVLNMFDTDAKMEMMENILDHVKNIIEDFSNTSH